MLVFANNLMRDSIYGMVWRVSIGAFLSVIDAATDVYVIALYYTQDLTEQANVMLSMILVNVGLQIAFALIQYKKKSFKVKLLEVIVCILFLRPAVDAYRVSTNYNDSDVILESIKEMMGNKVRFLFQVVSCQICRSNDIPFRPILIC